MPTYTRIPVMYHPTSVVLLDDDHRFLVDVSLILDEHTPFVFDDDVRKIFHYLESHSYERGTLSALVSEQVLGSENPLSSNSETLAIDFSPLHQNISRSDRFKKSTVALIDRLMKQQDGLEFCRMLREKNIDIKSVLFTGQTGADEAIDAFNQKIIDGYLVKAGAPRALVQKINSTIREQEWQFFLELGDSLSGPLFHLLKSLRDPVFISIFEHIRQEKGIVEFYLLDSNGSFLLINAKGQAWQLFVKNESDFIDCYDMALDAEASVKVSQALQNRTHFPYTKESMGYIKLSKPEDWDKAIVSMTKVPNQELYYAVVDRPDIQVFSLNRYLEEELMSSKILEN